MVGLVIAIIVFAVIFAVAFVPVAYRAIKVVPEFDRLVVFRLGRCIGHKGPGLVWLWPILDHAVTVDLREQVLEVPHQTTITRQNAPIYSRIVNPVESVVQVAEFARASQGLATTTLRAVIGDIELDSVLSRREEINRLLQTKSDEVTARWGVKVTSVEIREIVPPRDVQEAINRQLSAERTRRATVTEAEGKRQASITVADGEKQAAVLRAEGERQAAILRQKGSVSGCVRLPRWRGTWMPSQDAWLISLRIPGRKTTLTRSRLQVLPGVLHWRTTFAPAFSGSSPKSRDAVLSLRGICLAAQPCRGRGRTAMIADETDLAACPAPRRCPRRPRGGTLQVSQSESP